jgi:hypothetical protein
LIVLPNSVAKTKVLKDLVPWKKKETECSILASSISGKTAIGWRPALEPETKVRTETLVSDDE